MNDVYTDTIAALATAPGEGAIAVVRVSGPESLVIADRIFKGKGAPPSRQPANSFKHGFVSGAGGVADEVILLLYHAPHSYTRENAIEIQGHGGSAAAQRILRAVLDAGARLAEPGEFTKRAFLNGRIDLLQAEAVIDLIRARTDRAAQSALEQLSGTLSLSFRHLYDATLALAADLETTLDFSEDELPESFTKDVEAKLNQLETEFKALLSSWHEGHLLREGALVVIAGKPNAGKSTLLNALLGRERAIVTPIAGTTRDTIEEQLVINGLLVRITDTAGLRESSCEIETEGIRRTRYIIANAGLVIYLIDGSKPQDDYDSAQIMALHRNPLITVVSKSDLIKEKTYSTNAPDQSVLLISALKDDGIAELKTQIITKLGIPQGTQHQTTISERHRRLLISAHKDIREASLLLARAVPEPTLAASRLRMALETLGEATGRTYHDELLNNIFSRFCIGK
ncbi:MAG: tRNA uridine-5-carboxymethylaminomethyl(34) synthesis GTPase MnmE [bacterium]